MRVSELGNRYAKALFALSTENHTEEKVFSDLRVLEKVFVEDKDAFSYLTSVTVSAEDKQKTIKTALAKSGISPDLENMIDLMAARNRMSILSELTQAFQAQIDHANGVARGVVRSASALGPEERKQIEAKVESAINKKVIMTYKVDANLIGGLVAQVGSFTFDDSIDAHLRKIHDDLNRRTV